MLRKNDHYITEKIEESNSLGTKRVWKDFERVGNQKSWEGKIVKAVEQENEPDKGVGEALVTGLAIDSRKSGLKAVKYDHTEHGGQKQSSTTNSIDRRRNE